MTSRGGRGGAPLLLLALATVFAAVLASPAAGQNAAQARTLASLGVQWRASATVAAGTNGQPATTVPLDKPAAVAYDAAGNFYIADQNNNLIRKVDTAGLLTNYAGTGDQDFSGDGGPATQATLNHPLGIAVDTAGNVYISDTGNQRIRRVTAAGVISTVAGTGAAGFSGDGGLATQAILSRPAALVVDAAGNVFFADSNNHRIREVVQTTGNIVTVAGSGDQGFGGDGGSALTAQLDTPEGIAVDSAARVYLADTHNNRIRRVSNGTITTIAGNGMATIAGDAGTATSASFAALGLAEQQLNALLTMQFRARQSGYAQQFPGALDMILTASPAGADSNSLPVPVARHLIERRTDGYRGLDLAVLPEWRNRGVGTWAIEQVQAIAAAEGVPFRLRVLRSNRARALYERLGFFLVSADDISLEIEWAIPSASTTGVPSGTPAGFGEGSNPASQQRPGHMQTIERIADFLRSIGIAVTFGQVPAGSFLPGIQLVANGLRVHPPALRVPGDLLHEGAHLALMTPARRASELPVADDPAEELGALAWSYAAAIHLGIAPEVVFHPEGYRGQSNLLIETFRDNPQPLGVPFLARLGLTTMPFPGSRSIDPQMLRWVRGDADGAVPELVTLDIPSSVRLPYRFGIERLQQEVASMPESVWQPHFNRNDYSGEWSSVALRSRSGAASDIVPGGSASDFRDTPLLAQMPTLRTVLQHFDFPLKSVRLMRLHPRSEILEHRDRDLTLAEGELRLHVPIFTSDAVEFYLAGERLPLRAGECWYVDFSQPHRILNPGPAHRTHLVLDGVANSFAVELLRDAARRDRVDRTKTHVPQELCSAG